MQMEMSISEMLDLTPLEFVWCVKGFQKRQTEQVRPNWDQHRGLLTTIYNMISKKTYKPTDIMRFPWDDISESKHMTKEEMKAILKRNEELNSKPIVSEQKWVIGT